VLDGEELEAYFYRAVEDLSSDDADTREVAISDLQDLANRNPNLAYEMVDTLVVLDSQLYNDEDSSRFVRFMAVLNTSGQVKSHLVQSLINNDLLEFESFIYANSVLFNLPSNSPVFNQILDTPGISESVRNIVAMYWSMAEARETE
jgi:hypothetical protein